MTRRDRSDSRSHPDAEPPVASRILARVLQRRVIGERDVVLAFQRAGLALRRRYAAGERAIFTRTSSVATPSVDELAQPAGADDRPEQIG